MTSGRGHEFLRDAPGAPACLLGNHAIVRGALEAGIRFYSCYPGTPSSEIGDAFARIAAGAGIAFEYSVNEKVAVEVAFGASLAGARAMCGMKHVGLSYASDPVSTIPYVGVDGGLVIVSAGDPSLITSPNEQDQRHLARFLYYPVLDPATPADARDMTRFAFGFSEATRLPVLLRPTTRVCHGSGMVELGPLPAGDPRPLRPFEKNPPRHVPIPVNARRMRGELIERLREAERLLARSPFFPRRGSGRRGIVASGAAWTYAAQVLNDLGIDLDGGGGGSDVTLQKIGAYPIPARVLDELLEGVDSLLVLEELTPFVEERVSLHAFRRGRRLPILGKETGHLPLAFEYSPDLVEDAVREYLELGRRERASVQVPELPERPPVLCPGCPHRASFRLTRRVFGKKTVYCNDIGCYTLGYGEPLDSCDVLLCMGSSITQASGIARMTGKRTVAYIGDSTFFHSGLPALANAVLAGDEITVVILDNGTTAMTGFQPSPGQEGALSIEEAVRGLGAREVAAVDPFDEGAALAVLRRAKAGSGTNVVVMRAPCAVRERRLRKGAGGDDPPPYVVDPEACNACSLCVRALGCPAIVVAGGRYAVEEELCAGCDLCARVCAHDAIHPREPERT